MPRKREEEQLRGTVRVVRAKRSRLSDIGSASHERDLWSRTWEYDRAGNLIESSHYDSRGVQQNTLRYKYDSGGREIESVEYDGNGALVRRTVFVYDDNGRLSNECVYLAEGSQVIQRSATITPDGKRIVETRSESGARSSVEVWDTDDKPLEVTVYNEDGSLKDKFVYFYTAAGKRIRTVRYAPRDTTAEGFDDVPVVETIYTYDAAGRIIETLHLRGGSPGAQTLYKYDADGNKIEEIKHEAGQVSHVETYDREFDHEGNWITETKTKLYPQRDNRTFSVVTRRHIEYY
jgi:YD repeat-containing protein